MKRLMLGLAALALALPASAGAKGLVALSVCGSNGCHTTRDKHELAGAMQSIYQADPGETRPYFRLRETIGEPGQPDVIGHVESHWLPAVGVIATPEPQFTDFARPTAQTRQVLDRLAKGLHAFGAPAAKQDGGVGTNWAWSLLVIPAGALLLWRRRLA